MPFSPEAIAARAKSRAARPRPAGGAAPAVPITSKARRPGPVPAGAVRRAADVATRDLVFAAAAEQFSRHGFDGVGVDDIARAAGVNKAMIYYHHANKLELYRAVVREMLQAFGAAVAAVAASDDPPARKIEHFIETLASMREARPWFPPLMMREMAAGAPRLDADTLGHMKTVLAAFSAILDAGVQARVFRKVQPVMAYMTIMGPLLMNAVRERAAAAPGRAHLPLFTPIDRRELIAHMQLTALRMLAKDPSR
jgi:AcrR family transcriptional regulator